MRSRSSPTNKQVVKHDRMDSSSSHGIRRLSSFVACMLLITLGAHAQTMMEQLHNADGLDDPFGSAAAPQCDAAALPARLVALEAACPGDGSSCDVDCAGAPLPLLTDCGPLINRLYDAADGQEDGVATLFTNARDECEQQPVDVLLQYIQTLHDQGRCPDAALDGVAETQVKA
eukprot:SAG22_NODE_7114_length_774_cov_1.536296_1_plen_173_part_01